MGSIRFMLSGLALFLWSFGAAADPIEGNVPVIPITVTNAQNSGPGSLRQAIVDANSSVGLSHIAFSIPGGCPTLIALQSPLPDIESDVLIQGFSQPGSSPNTAAMGSNAVHCVVVYGGNSTPHALRVPSAESQAKLRVRGLAFSGFSDRAVIVLGGHDHEIAGNQFGGELPSGPLFINASHVHVAGNANGFIVGGAMPADRNVFGASGNSPGAGVAIRTDAAGGQILNNLIGLNPDLKSSSSNRVGVIVGGDLTTIKSNLIAGNTGNAIEILADGAVVQNNVIGFHDGTNARPNGGAGVLLIAILNEPAGNTIGSLSLTGNPVSSANTVAHNLGGGIELGEYVGASNMFRGNVLHDNGPGPQIDLGEDGPDPDDAGDLDAGPNTRLNSPKLTATPSGNSLDVAVSFASAQGQYVIDVYKGAACSGGLGTALEHIHTAVLTVTSGGTGSLSFSIANPGTDFSLSATATSASGSTSEFGPCVNVGALNLPPLVTLPLADQVHKEGAVIHIDLSNHFSDPDGDPLSFSVSNGVLPSGLFLAGSLIHGGLSAAGSYPGIAITATDGKGGTATDSFDWTVTSNAAPVFSGEPYAFAIAAGQPAGTTIGTVSATDPDPGTSLFFAIAGGNASGVFAMDGQTGVVSVANGALLIDGIYSLTVTVSDGSTFDTATVTITVGAETIVVFGDGFEVP